MHRLFVCGLLAMLAMPAWPAFADDNSPAKPFEVGVVPYLSARVLVAGYEPLRLYLERVLGKPVKIYTSTGFKQFFMDSKRGDFDLVISAAHFARILQKEYKFTPLLRYSAGGHGLVMTALNSPIKTLQDLRGQVIAVPDQLSLATIVCMDYLHENGLQSGTDFRLLEVPSFVSAILSVQKGDAMAAISSPSPLAQMHPELRESVRPVLVTNEYISLVFLAHPRLAKTTADLLKNELPKFGSESHEGKQFLSSTGFGAIVPVTEKEMRSLDRYVAETKRLLDDAR